MALTRKIVQSLADEIYMTNKTFGNDREENDKHYKKFRDLLAQLELLQINAQVSETWENGMVCIEAGVEGVKY